MKFKSSKLIVFVLKLFGFLFGLFFSMIGLMFVGGGPQADAPNEARFLGLFFFFYGVFCMSLASLTVKYTLKHRKVLTYIYVIVALPLVVFIYRQGLGDITKLVSPFLAYGCITLAFAIIVFTSASDGKSNGSD